MAQRMQIFISGKSRCSQSHSSDAVIAWWGWGCKFESGLHHSSYLICSLYYGY